MITAEKINKLSNLSSAGLNQALSNAGYTMFERVMDREFLGITNGGDFCYKFIYRDSTEGTWAYGKLFVKTLDDGTIVADY
jgi:hypothetical protein